MKIWNLFLAMPLAAMLAGCGNGERTVRYEDLKNADTLVTIDGTPVMKAKFERDLRFRMLLEAKRNPRMKVVEAQELERTLYAGGIDYLVLKRAYAKEAEARKIRPTAEDLEKARRGLMKKYARGQKNWEKFTKDLGLEAAVRAEEELAFEALRIKVNRELRAQLRQEISAEELDKIIAERDAYNERSRKTERETYALATNVWRGIVADTATNAFENAAGKLEAREHVSYDAEWNDLSDEMFKEEPAIAKLLPKMKIGDITPPIEGDNGLVILKLTRKGLEEGFSTQPRQHRYDFKKIFFALPAFAEELPREAFAKQIADKRAEKAATAAIKARCQSVTVNYPTGKVVFE